MAKNSQKQQKVLPKLYRLKSNSDIQRVFEKGKSFKEDFLILRIAPNNLGQIRFAFVVSQKFSKKANLRNRIKRKLRELVRLKLNNIKTSKVPLILKGVDAIIIATPGLETKDFWEIAETIDKLFKKAKLNKRKKDD